MSYMFLFVIVVGCGSEEVDGDGKVPADIPLEWANAEVQKDQATRAKLLVESDGTMSTEKGPQNDHIIEDYKLTEWKVDSSRYYYEITYRHPTESKLKTEQMEVVKTESGWKRTKYGDMYNFDKLIEDLEPEVIKELHEE